MQTPEPDNSTQLPWEPSLLVFGLFNQTIMTNGYRTVARVTATCSHCEGFTEKDLEWCGYVWQPGKSYWESWKERISLRLQYADDTIFKLHDA